jgi:GTPase SAR1 family protein
MRNESIVIAGLPGSGKTTFLAALWHVINARDVPTALKLGRLVEGDQTHLNQIAARWRTARVQDRTPGLLKKVRMNLEDKAGATLPVEFPDISGEAFVRMWEDRDCDPELVPTLHARGVALFVHSDTIVFPRWLLDDIQLSGELGLAADAAEPIDWSPRGSPTQVQLVDILQLLTTAPLDVGPRRLAIMLSAWDKADGEQLSPVEFLAAKLPLLEQFVTQRSAQWDLRVYGISAQGGEYDPKTNPGEPVVRSPEAEALRDLDHPSERIRVVHSGETSHDITSPLAWLMA